MDSGILNTKDFLITKKTIEGLTDLKSLVREMRQNLVLTTKQIRQVLLYFLIKIYSAKRDMECFASNATLRSDLMNYGFQISTSIIKSDLKELEAEGLIQRILGKQSKRRMGRILLAKGGAK